jgi:uncharacterized membrane protein
MAKTILALLSLGIALLLIAAGFSKLSRPDLFAGAIDNYRIFPCAISVGLAYFLPWFEITVGFGLLFKRSRAGSALLAVFLFAAFSASIISALFRGLDIQCGCFGALGEAGRRPLELALLRSTAGLGASLWIFRTKAV